MRTKPFSSFLSELPRELILPSRKLPQRVKFARSANRARQRTLKYPFSFHLDTRAQAKWRLGVWRAYSFVQLAFKRG